MVGDKIEALHQAVFGFVPEKRGTAYERLASIVLAVLGWEDVQHDLAERPAGRRAKHQLDVVARRPDGEVARLVVECKDWDTTVGKRVMDSLTGVCKQIGADAAAVITTKGFTKGARAVAADEDIAMVRLRPFDPARDEGTYIKRVEVLLEFGFPIPTDLEVELDDDNIQGDGPWRVEIHDWTELRRVDGTPAETVGELLRSEKQLPPPGKPRRERRGLPERRLVQAESGEWLAIKALSWTVTVHTAEEKVVSEAKGEPKLVLQQLDEHGDPYGGKVLSDDHLNMWEIAEDGRVRQRRPPGGGTRRLYHPIPRSS